MKREREDIDSGVIFLYFFIFVSKIMCSKSCANKIFVFFLASRYQLRYATDGDCATDNVARCKLGSLKRTIPSDLSDWYHNLVDGLFVMQECTEEYDRYLGELLFIFFTCRSA